MLSILLAKTLSLYGLAVYISIGVINNVLDNGTNIFLLGQMFSMTHLKNDKNLALGLVCREAKNKNFAKYTLQVIVIFQSLWVNSSRLDAKLIFDQRLCLWKASHKLAAVGHEVKIFRNAMLLAARIGKFRSLLYYWYNALE